MLMGNCCSRADMIGRMMTGRNTAPQICEQSNPCNPLLQPDCSGDLATRAMQPQEDDFMVEGDLPCPVLNTSNLVEKEEGTEKTQVSPRRFSMISSLARFIPKLPSYSRKEAELKLESILEEKTTLIDELRRNEEAQQGHVQNWMSVLDRANRINHEIQAVSCKEVQLLKSIIEDKEKDLEAEKMHASQLEAKCQKLQAQLAPIEQEAAQESCTSGSYSDDRANPGMLEGACKAMDKAIEALARFVHNNSVTKVLALKSPELEHFVRQISPAHPAEFSRAIQVRYVWAHWIFHQMFQGFEHVFFGADGGTMTSPLNAKKHAVESFQRFRHFQQEQDSSGLFQAYFPLKYKKVFSSRLVSQASIPPDIICNENGQLNGEGELHVLFMDVARAVWLLHELAFSFDPPASILRMAKGTPFDKQFHESVIHDEGGHGMSSQMVSLMIRPAFRVRKSIIRSRVFLCNNLGLKSTIPEPNFYGANGIHCTLGAVKFFSF